MHGEGISSCIQICGLIGCGLALDDVSVVALGLLIANWGRENPLIYISSFSVVSCGWGVVDEHVDVARSAERCYDWVSIWFLTGLISSVSDRQVYCILLLYVYIYMCVHTYADVIHTYTTHVICTHTDRQTASQAASQAGRQTDRHTYIRSTTPQKRET